MAGDKPDSPKKGPEGKPARIPPEAYEDIMACAKKGEKWPDTLRSVAKFSRAFFERFGRAGMEGMVEGSIKFTAGKLATVGSYRHATRIKEQPGPIDVEIEMGTSSRKRGLRRRKPSPDNVV